MSYDTNKRYVAEFSDVTADIGFYNVNLNSASHEIPRYPWDIPLHSHNSYEIHFLESGTGSMIVDGTTYEVSAGDMIITGPNILHAQNSGLVEPMEEYCINVSFIQKKYMEAGKNDLIRLIDSITQHPFIICRGISVKAEFDMLLTEAFERKCGWRERTAAIMTSLLISVGRLIIQDESFEPIKDSSDTIMTSKTINRRRQIDKYFRGYLNTMEEETLAKQLFVSRRQLSRIMRKCYSMTFNEKVNELRVEYAKNLLITTDMPISEIPSACGFSSLQYFYKVFAKKYGISPAKLRRNVQSGQKGS